MSVQILVQASPPEFIDIGQLKHANEATCEYLVAFFAKYPKTRSLWSRTTRQSIKAELHDSMKQQATVYAKTVTTSASVAMAGVHLSQDALNLFSTSTDHDSRVFINQMIEQARQGQRGAEAMLNAFRGMRTAILAISREHFPQSTLSKILREDNSLDICPGTNLIEYHQAGKQHDQALQALKKKHLLVLTFHALSRLLESMDLFVRWWNTVYTAVKKLADTAHFLEQKDPLRLRLVLQSWRSLKANYDDYQTWVSLPLLPVAAKRYIVNVPQVMRHQDIYASLLLANRS
ncbi:hypothetical protein HGRIS_006620 [Hohenbuehelia grisea]|uniref:Uncharacterized protein n=1 Tax=Hohenbuehelia grisea TaxID=104357 RepID=A0ABR3J9I9_9AGAR